MSLVEVLVSMVILSLVAGGMYATFSFIGKGAALSRNEIQSLYHACGILEYLRNSVSTESGHNILLNEGVHNPTITGSMSCSYNVQDVHYVIGGEAEYKKVTVTVTWPD